MKPTLVLTGGMHRSRRLYAPEGRETRPTRAMVREALFSMLQGAYTDAQVLDLFAGSGALGFEALSRGASDVVFCDHGVSAALVVQKNIALLKEESRCTLLRMDWRQALARLTADGKQFDLVMLDPPYGLDLEPVLAALRSGSLLKPGAILCLEHGAKADIALPDGFGIFRSRRYGDSALTLMTAKTEDMV